MKTPDDLDRRRARVQRLAAKRPEGLRVEVTCAPAPGALEGLVDLLAELLAARGLRGPR